MGHFSVILDGAPPAEAVNKFWAIITRYDVNCMILDRQCLIFGYADDKTIDELLEKLKEFGLAIIVERGLHYEEGTILDSF